jgi:hypothetical protein
VTTRNVAYVSQNYKTDLPKEAFQVMPTDTLEIFQIIQGQNKNFASECDSIFAGFCDKTTLLIFVQLADSDLINRAIECERFSDCLKESKVVPIHNLKNKLDMNNYHPIFVLSTLNKILEIVLLRRFNDYFGRHGIINDQQSLFKYAHGDYEPV